MTEILINPLYTGFICSKTYGIDWLEGQHDGLISLETFDKVQARRKSVAKAPSRKNAGNDFALRGIVTCGDCNVPLRSSWSKGRNQLYAYYLCQTKTCDSYGKSIARDKIEGEVGQIIKTLQPKENLIALTKAMFAQFWEQREAQAKEALKTFDRQVQAADKQIEALLGRIMDATNETVVRTYEGKIGELERSKLKLLEQKAKQAIPKGAMEEKLEPALQFLASPWKLWESGNTTLRRLVLKLAFAERIQYHRKLGARTPELSLPFKMLRGDSGNEVRFGAGERT